MSGLNGAALTGTCPAVRSSKWRTPGLYCLSPPLAQQVAFEFGAFSRADMEFDKQPGLVFGDLRVGPQNNFANLGTTNPTAPIAKSGWSPKLKHWMCLVYTVNVTGETLVQKKVSASFMLWKAWLYAVPTLPA